MSRLICGVYVPRVVGAGVVVVVVVGQGPRLHGWFSVGLPLQGLPPFDGGGLVQVLVHLCVPRPHVEEQEDLFHAVHPPSTNFIENNTTMILS